MRKEYITLIPAYKPVFDEDERQCVERYVRVLTEGDMAFFVPEDLDVSWYKAHFPTVHYIRFDKRFFKGINGYNHLLLSEAFYRRFLRYPYILIAQPDAVVWQDSDRIAAFTEKGYDYYGAPWIPERRIWEWIFPKKKGFPGFRIHCCKRAGGGIVMGNGGFSLRRPEACRKLIRKYRWRKSYWYWKRNEDIFFGVLGMDNRNDFRLADVETGKEFALEYGLKESVKAGKIPYAVHGWKKEFASYEEMRAFLAEYDIRI